MSKENRTLDIFLDNVSQDWSWRIKELDDFKTAMEQTRYASAKSALIRGGITLLYAHWEGFVKKCAYNYYNFVTTKGFKLNELSDSFIAISIREELDGMIDSRKIIKQLKVISILFQELEKRGIFPSDIPLKTSNLNFEVFEEYCYMIGIETLPFETKRQFLNERLVWSRNNIAHGKHLLINEDGFSDIYKLTIQLMSNFKDAIQNAAILASYKRVA